MGSPGVQLVHRAVHAHGDAHHVQAAALSHAVDDARQPRGAHVRGARGHALAGAAHDVAVGGGGPQPQSAQDVVDLLAVARVAAGRGGEASLALVAPGPARPETPTPTPAWVSAPATVPRLRAVARMTGTGSAVRRELARRGRAPG